MDTKISNDLSSERSVETRFIVECIQKYGWRASMLDVGGVPTKDEFLQPILKAVDDMSTVRKVCDFRPCDYQGDFVALNISEKFDLIAFLSSLEHFPQCTESDRVFRPGYDRMGFQKAISLLNPGGHILLTVPFGKRRWQPYHQNYNWQGIKELTAGSDVTESHIYRLEGNLWVKRQPEEMEEVLYTDRAYGVGCFVCS